MFTWVGSELHEVILVDSVVEIHVKMTLLVVKDQRYDKVIFILELRYHGFIKMNQKAFFLCLPVYSMNHVSLNIIFISNLKDILSYL